jgi:flagellin-like hook-associated protein FlgL
MISKKNSLYIFLLIGAVVLLSSFKNKNKKLTGTVYVDQTDAPSGTTQVYSKVGTKVFDINRNLIYTFDTANIGMTKTGVNGFTDNVPANTYSVVFGDTFQNGLPAYVDINDVQIL